MARSVATSSAGAFPQFKVQLAALTRDVADALKPVAPLRDVWLPEFPEPGRSQSKAVRVFDREVALSVLRRIIAEPTMGQLLDALFEPTRPSPSGSWSMPLARHSTSRHSPLSS